MLAVRFCDSEDLQPSSTLEDQLIATAIKLSREGDVLKWTPLSSVITDKFGNCVTERIKAWLRNHVSEVAEPDRNLEWLDQDPFPMLDVRKSRVVDEGNMRAIGIRLDFDDLKLMREHVVHHRPLRWDLVKQQWTANPITNLAEFEALLQDCPNKMICLTALSNGNLLSLTDRSFKKHQTGAGFIGDCLLNSLGSFSNVATALPQSNEAKFYCLLKGIFAHHSQEETQEEPGEVTNTIARIVQDFKEACMSPRSSVSSFIESFWLWMAQDGFLRYSHSKKDHQKGIRVTIGELLAGSVSEHLSAEVVGKILELPLVPELLFEGFKSEGFQHKQKLLLKMSSLESNPVPKTHAFGVLRLIFDAGYNQSVDMADWTEDKLWDSILSEKEQPGFADVLDKFLEQLRNQEHAENRLEENIKSYISY